MYFVPTCTFAIKCVSNIQKHVFRSLKARSCLRLSSLTTWPILFLTLSQLFFQLIPSTLASSLDSTTNFPPRFASQPGDSAEIVLRIKEGPSSLQREIYRLVGEDPDPGDQLQFGVLGAMGADLLRIENHSPARNQASVFLRKELDRETQDSYHLVLTLTDGKLGKGNYVSQSQKPFFLNILNLVAQPFCMQIFLNDFFVAFPFFVDLSRHSFDAL